MPVPTPVSPPFAPAPTAEPAAPAPAEAPAAPEATAVVEDVAEAALSPGSLRPLKRGEFVENKDGSRSTERTVTFTMDDGSAILVPSLWMGPDGPADLRDDPDAILAAVETYERATGLRFPRFASEQEANTFARGRSEGGAVFSGPLTEADLGAEPDQPRRQAEVDEAEVLEDFARLQRLRPDDLLGAGGGRIPGRQGDKYRAALDEILAKYGSAQAFADALSLAMGDN